MSLRQSIENQWYGSLSWLWLLLPLNWLFVLLSKRKANKLKKLAEPQQIPLVVVGNISVGGTGKTPLIINLVKCLREQGFKPGVVSRGYGRKSKGLLVLDESTKVEQCGDEPKLIFNSAQCPLAVAEQRTLAVKALKDSGCDVILSDDGLQHYQMHRDIELAVVDSERGLGNGWRLPLGPLREPAERLNKVDFVLVNQGVENNFEFPGAVEFKLQARKWRNIVSGEELELKDLPIDPETSIHAVCAIGNPQRFYNTLHTLNINAQAHSFEDHHDFLQSDFTEIDSDLILMTEKDAVKCRSLALKNAWALVVEPKLPETFITNLVNKLNLANKIKENQDK